MNNDNRISLLFICLGNICRSPAAQAVMQQMVDEAGLAGRFFIDSAGIGAWHVGQLADKRMRDHAFRRGYRLTHRARQIDAEADFSRFDRLQGRSVCPTLIMVARRILIGRSISLKTVAGDCSAPSPLPIELMSVS